MHPFNSFLENSLLYFTRLAFCLYRFEQVCVCVCILHFYPIFSKNILEEYFQRCRRKMKVKRSKSLSPEPSSSNNSKRFKIGEYPKNGETLHPNLLDLSDDVLLNIMKYLRPQDLMSLSLCCQRLDQVTRDRTLWRIMDLRDTSILSEDLEKYMKFLGPLTTSLAINGNLNSKKYSNLSKSFFTAIGETSNQLKELIIEDYSIDGNKILITDFPPMIEKLSLNGCKVSLLQNNKSYFFRMDFHMLNLTCLILSKCRWFAPHSLLVISKIPKLKELRLDSCHGLGECVAYASLATRFGFKTLEILDLRDTALGDSEICCFSSTKTLTHLYLEYPSVLRNADSSRRSVQQRRSMPQPVYEDQNVAQYLEDEFLRENLERCLVSDRAICALGSYVCDRRVLNNALRGIILIEEDRRIFNNPHLKTLVVRNYPQVTNHSLIHLAVNASSLEYLDVTGTSVTKHGVQVFKSQKVNVKIVSSFDET